MFDSLHGLSHPGIQVTDSARPVVLPRINSDVRRWTWSCTQSQRSKIQWHDHPTFFLFHTQCKDRHCTYQPCGTSPTIPKVHLPPDVHGQIHTMAGSLSYLHHHRRSHHTSLCQLLDSLFWRPLHHCYRPRTTIRIQFVECTNDGAGNKASMYDSLSPPRAMARLKVPSPAKDSTKSTAQHHSMGRLPAIGTTGNQDGVGRGHPVNSGPNGLCYHIMVNLANSFPCHLF